MLYKVLLISQQLRMWWH